MSVVQFDNLAYLEKVKLFGFRIWNIDLDTLGKLDIKKDFKELYRKFSKVYRVSIINKEYNGKK